MNNVETVLVILFISLVAILVLLIYKIVPKAFTKRNKIYHPPVPYIQRKPEESRPPINKGNCKLRDGTILSITGGAGLSKDDVYELGEGKELQEFRENVDDCQDALGRYYWTLRRMSKELYPEF